MSPKYNSIFLKTLKTEKKITFHLFKLFYLFKMKLFLQTLNYSSVFFAKKKNSNKTSWKYKFIESSKGKYLKMFFFYHYVHF